LYAELVGMFQFRQNFVLRSTNGSHIGRRERRPTAAVGQAVAGHQDSALHHHALSGLAGRRLCRIATSVKTIEPQASSRSRHFDSSQGCKTSEITGLDIERERAMFPKDKIAWPGFLRFIPDAGA